MGEVGVAQLCVWRVLSTGARVRVGTLAQNTTGVYFAYEAEYLQQYGNLSPLILQEITEVQLARATPHGGLHGVFADSLPDGWGLLLQDRFFRQQGILPMQITPLDRLAFVGQSGVGGLVYEPAYEWHAPGTLDFAELGLQAQAIFDGQTQEVLQELLAVGSSGGARPKAMLYMPPEQPHHARSQAQLGDEAWIVKFTSQNLPLGHEEGLCEAAYLRLAEMAGLHPCTWRLLEAPKQSGASYWLAVQRFDVAADGIGRWHQHSASGLLHADFRAPSMDYEDLIKLTRHLCFSPEAAELQFRRAMFNLLACNQDDHSKNWAFLQADDGSWQVSPLYDVTFSPQRYGEHATAFAGYGKQPPVKAIQQLADRAGLTWPQAQTILQQTQECVMQFPVVARELGMRKGTVAEVMRVLERVSTAR